MGSGRLGQNKGLSGAKGSDREHVTHILILHPVPPLSANKQRLGFPHSPVPLLTVYSQNAPTSQLHTHTAGPLVSCFVPTTSPFPGSLQLCSAPAPPTPGLAELIFKPRCLTRQGCRKQKLVKNLTFLELQPRVPRPKHRLTMRTVQT